MYKSTELIMKEFDGKVKYIVAHTDSFECIVVGLALPGYPVRQLHYYCDEGNGVVVRLPELLNNVSNENYVAVLQECNALTLDTGCLKFGINDNMSVIAGYEFPEFTPDEGVGPMAFENIYTRGKALHVSAGGMVSYRQACKEGWAPAPTNDLQRGVWNEFHPAK